MFAVVEINYAFLELAIYEKKDKGFHLIEKVLEEIILFKGLKDENKISVEEITNICDILNKMDQLCGDYAVKDKKLIFSEFFKTTLNFSLLLDQIRIRTDFSVENINLDECSNLSIKKLLHMEKDIFLKNKSKLFFDLTSVESCVYLFYKGKINLHRHVEFSGERFYSLFEANDINPNKAYNHICDSLKIRFDSIKKNIGRKKIEKFIINGEVEEKILKKVFKTKKLKDIKISQIENELNEMKNHSYHDIAMKYKCSFAFARLLVIKLAIIIGFSRFFNVGEIEFLDFNIKDLCAIEHYNPKTKENLAKSLWRITVESLAEIGETFGAYNGHNEFIENFGLDLLDETKEQHDLTKNDYRKYIIASYLYNLGTIINYENFEEHSSYIIKNLHVFGIDDEIKEHVALIVENLSKKITLEDLLKLQSNNIDFVNDLRIIAVLRLAIALDTRKKQVFHDWKFSLEKSQLEIKLDTKEEAHIEKHMFNQEIDIFEYLFSTKVDLKINRRVEHE